MKINEIKQNNCAVNVEVMQTVFFVRKNIKIQLLRSFKF